MITQEQLSAEGNNNVGVIYSIFVILDWITYSEGCHVFNNVARELYFWSVDNIT